VPVLAGASLALAGGVVFAASQRPDGIEKLGLQTGIASHAKTFFTSPLAEYRLQLTSSPFLSKALAGIIGLVVIYVLCLAVSRVLVATRPAIGREGA
jgi:hypothetical protein